MNAFGLKAEARYDEDDPLVVAAQLYEMHGYQKALQTVVQYMNSAQNYSERLEWEKIARELACLSITDHEIQRAGLG